MTTSGTSELTYTVIEVRCNECLEYFWPGDQSFERWKANHAETHRLGRCDKCGHWNEEHHDQARFPQPVAGYHHGPLVCSHPIGMGDFCGCGTIKDD